MGDSFIFEMINTTNTKDGSWSGDIHALVSSKMLKIRIVLVNNKWIGLEEGWFDIDRAFFDDITSGFSDIMSSPAPKDQKTCYLYQINSIFSPYTCDWQNAMNHFEYLWKHQMMFLPMMINSVHTKGEWVLICVAIHLIYMNHGRI
jgi:hypothetical protein